MVAHKLTRTSDKLTGINDGSMAADKLQRKQFLENAFQRSVRISTELCPRRQPPQGTDSVRLGKLELELEVALVLGAQGPPARDGGHPRSSLCERGRSGGSVQTWDGR